MNRTPEHELGLHRVLDCPVVLPQNAVKLDIHRPLGDTEIEIAVECLQIDSASFRQLEQQHHSAENMARAIGEIILTRGKMQNPVTGSGGMLLGTVSAVGVRYPHTQFVVGTRVATLVSLTATPLKLDVIHKVHPAQERVSVEGRAYLFASSPLTLLPDFMSEGAALAAFDICGAPSLVLRHVQPGQTVFLLGLGKSGRASLAALRRAYGDRVRIIGVDAYAPSVKWCQDHYAKPGDHFQTLDAIDPVTVMNVVVEATQGRLADVSINLVNRECTEMPTILATRDQGKVIFFSMATDFKRASLGCESVGKDLTLLMGNGYVNGHAELMINLLRDDLILRREFEKQFGDKS